MVQVKIILNGKEIEKEIPSQITLYEYLKDQYISSIKAACHHGDCGLCTVIMDDKLVKSCLVLAVEASNSTITTLEGLNDDPVTTIVKRKFEQNHAVQCGYCTPAFILAAVTLLKSKQEKNEDLSHEEILESINGILCRCTGYKQIIDSMMEASLEVSQI